MHSKSPIFTTAPSLLSLLLPICKGLQPSERLDEANMRHNNELEIRGSARRSPGGNLLRALFTHNLQQNPAISRLVALFTHCEGVDAKISIPDPN
jgi:hypothetical protein